MVQLSYPGVYVAEHASGARPISGVATSVTAFVGYTGKGAPDKAVAIASFADFERGYGGLDRNSPVSYAVQHFFLNGGTQALIVRVGSGYASAGWVLCDDAGNAVLSISAASPGGWGNHIRVCVNTAGARLAEREFHLVVEQLTAEGTRVVAQELHNNLNLDAGSPQFVETAVNAASSAIRVQYIGSAGQRPTGVSRVAPSTPGEDGTRPGAVELIGSEQAKTGMQALRGVELFNVLAIPETFDMLAGEEAPVIAAAVALCEHHGAFYIVDAPANRTLADIGQWARAASQSRNGATYFPAVVVADPLDDSRPRTIAPSGVLAGLYARTDANRGVWKSPAGIEASLSGVQALSVTMNDEQNGQLNPLGVNALRSFPAYGNVAWGARTLRGADTHADEYKYIAVRRLALFIEQSLERGTRWAVFEPNDEPLWAQIRLNVGAFMNGLFRQGAFQGNATRDAFFVQCDAQTISQNDRDLGIVTARVGFAPLKPAEFVVLTLQQRTGQTPIPE